MKDLEFHGSSLNDLKSFPDEAKQDAGYQLHLVQNGHDPDDWKPMNKAIGAGVKEIRINDNNNKFRVLYVAKFKGTIHVLHAFPKKTQQTRGADKDIAKKRYKDLLKRQQL